MPHCQAAVLGWYSLPSEYIVVLTHMVCDWNWHQMRENDIGNSYTIFTFISIAHQRLTLQKTS